MDWGLAFLIMAFIVVVYLLFSYGPGLAVKS